MQIQLELNDDSRLDSRYRLVGCLPHYLQCPSCAQLERVSQRVIRKLARGLRLAKDNNTNEQEEIRVGYKWRLTLKDGTVKHLHGYNLMAAAEAKWGEFGAYMLAQGVPELVSDAEVGKEMAKVKKGGRHDK